MVMRSKQLALLAGLALVLAACTSTVSKVTVPYLAAQGSIEGAWELESATFDGEPIPIVLTHPITITLDQGNVGGTAACNGYGGIYVLSGDEIAFTEFAATQMACSPNQVMLSEQTYLTALLNVETANVEDERLVLRGSRTELVYDPLQPVPTADLQNTVWVLDSLVQGEAVSTVSGDRATLELFSDGSFIGSTGCRTITGDYIVSGAEVVFTSWGAHGECPAALSDQDSQVISALEGGFRVEIEGDTMTTWVAGDEGLIYKADS